MSAEASGPSHDDDSAHVVFSVLLGELGELLCSLPLPVVVQSSKYVIVHRVVLPVDCSISI